MKKITSFILVLVMILSLAALTGCEKSSYETFKDAMEKTNSLDSYSATMNMDISIEMMGMTVKVPMNYDFKVAGIQTEKPQIISDVNMSVLGVDMSMDLYSDGEYAYISSSETGNIKTKLNSVQGGEYDILSDVDNIMVILPEDAFNEVVFTAGEGGVKTTTFTIPKELFNEYFGDIISDVAAQSGGTENASAEIGDISLTIAINKDGYICQYDMSFSMNLSVDIMGTAVDIASDVVAGIEFHNPGEAVTVTPPEGIEAYPEV